MCGLLTSVQSVHGYLRRRSGVHTSTREAKTIWICHKCKRTWTCWAIQFRWMFDSWAEDCVTWDFPFQWSKLLFACVNVSLYYTWWSHFAHTHIASVCILSSPCPNVIFNANNYSYYDQFTLLPPLDLWCISLFSIGKILFSNHRRFSCPSNWDEPQYWNANFFWFFVNPDHLQLTHSDAFEQSSVHILCACACAEDQFLPCLLAV